MKKFKMHLSKAGIQRDNWLNVYIHDTCLHVFLAVFIYCTTLQGIFINLIDFHTPFTWNITSFYGWCFKFTAWWDHVQWDFDEIEFFSPEHIPSENELI